MAEKLYLIDGTALLYRAYYAFIKQPLINSRGQNTSAIYGTVNSFLKLLDTFSPTRLGIGFDRREKTFRHELSEDYKANRPPMPDDLVTQVEPAHEFFRLADVPEFSLAGFEADDVLATLAELFKERFEVVIVTSDKDYAQLVDERVTLYDPFKDRTLDAAAVREKYGVEPEQFIDWLALTGDASDNIPGVRGVGPKGATALLTQFGTLDALYDRLDEVSSASLREKLAQGRADAMLSRTLATIDRHVALNTPDDNAFTFQPQHLAGTLDFFDLWEMGSLRRKVVQRLEESDLDFLAPASTEPPQTAPGMVFEPVLVDSPAAFEAMLADLAAADPVAVDTETTSTDQLTAELVGISLCGAEERAYYISLAHTFGDNLSVADVLPRLRTALAGKTLVAHNLKYDWTVLRRAGWEMPAPLRDTMIASYLLDPGRLQHGLDKCAEIELGHTMIPLSSLIGTGKNQMGFESVLPQQAAEYSAEDAAATWRLWRIYEKRLADTGLTDLFLHLEMPLALVLARMEETGVYIDAPMLDELSRRARAAMTELAERIQSLAGHTFNLNSTQQLGQVLFDELKLPVVKRTKTGYSTDSDVLEQLAPEHEIVRLMLDYRQLAKLDGTYLSALPKLVSERDGRLHTSFNQTVASTGRLSSSNPNLQNIPVRTQLGREVRKAFCPQQPGWVILAADYSQIELRLAALLSGDETLLAAFRNNEDIHTQTAARIFGKPAAEVTPDDRRRAKVINFGILYGMGPQRLSRELEISQKEAKAFIEQYFAKFPAVSRFIEEQVKSARSLGYAQTLFGRRLYLPALQGNNRQAVSEAERVAVNMPVQGGAADIIKRAMLAINARLQGRQDALMILQVHDELVFEVRSDSLEEIRALVVREMEAALPPELSAKVRLKVDAGSGANWYEAH